jgi:hypothetical protein
MSSDARAMPRTFFDPVSIWGVLIAEPSPERRSPAAHEAGRRRASE